MSNAELIARLKRYTHEDIDALMADIVAALEAAEAEVAALREALEPFAAVAEYDIGDDEVDADYYRQPTSLRWAKAPAKVGDYRAARAALEGK